MLGELAVGQGMYGADTLHVHPHGTLDDTPAQLADALGELVDRARESGCCGPARHVAPAGGRRRPVATAT